VASIGRHVAAFGLGVRPGIWKISINSNEFGTCGLVGAEVVFKIIYRLHQAKWMSYDIHSRARLTKGT
jgi:hypothetical protein